MTRSRYTPRAMSAELQPPTSQTAENIAVNAGWLVAAGTAAWGGLLKFMLGRHLKSADRIEAKLDDLIERVAKLEGYTAGAHGRKEGG